MHTRAHLFTHIVRNILQFDCCDGITGIYFFTFTTATAPRKGHTHIAPTTATIAVSLRRTSTRKMRTNPCV